MFERISILIIAAMFAMLAVPGLWALTLSATADEHVEGGTMMTSQKASRDTPSAGKSDSGARAGASASSNASASAKAGASSSTDGSGKGGCRAQSSSTAGARSGDERVYDSDRDTAYDESGDCRAEAESSASARVGDRGGE